MDLHKTITLPEDKQEAQKEFQKIVWQEKYVLLIVLGAEAMAENIVKLGDKLAGGATQDTWRRVVWVKKPDDVVDLLRKIPNPKNLPDITKPETAACTLSRSDEIRDIILRTEPAINLGRVSVAFMKAEANNEPT